MKKLIAMAIVSVLMLGVLTGCGTTNTTDPTDTGSEDVATSTPTATTNNAPITVVSREDGSGTRGAFVELMGIMVDDVDNTTVNAEISNSTSVVSTTVAGNKNAIGYISLGSMNDTVKAVMVDGVEATVENIKSGDYAVARPFNIATKGEISEVAQDFIDYIMSAEGQAVVSEDGYISVEGADSYTASGLSGTITVAGSTSVSPLMEKLAEAYKELNPNVSIEIQQSGSSAGMTSAMEGACDIGMASRELKDSEAAELTATVIAMDGIAVIINNDNGVNDLTSEQIMKIFTGEITNWSEVG